MELGSGAGLLGLSLLKCLRVNDYTFTDCHYQVLNSLINNLRLNFPSEEEDEDADENVEERLRQQLHCGPPVIVKEGLEHSTSYHQVVRGRQVVVRHLDWTSRLKPLPLADVVLGADIVYERGLLPPLCSLLRQSLETSASVAYIACTERSYTTLECFETALHAEELDFKVIARRYYGPTDTILVSDVLHRGTRLYCVRLRPHADDGEHGHNGAP